MAVMSTIGATEHKPTSAAPTPVSAGAGSMASDEAMGMDLDTHGTNETPSDNAASSKEVSDHNGARSPFVNGGSKPVSDAPPSPPVPTPPLHPSSDPQGLSDLHITSPDTSFIPGGFGSSDIGMEDEHPNGVVKTESTNAEGSAKREREENGTVQSEVKKAKPTVPEADGDKPMKDASSPPPAKAARDRDEEDGEDRPSKRAKTEDAPEDAAATTASVATSTDSDTLTPPRHHHILSAIRSLRRSKDARPFTMPVDAVKLNVPHYYKVITNPMDLQTMERKMSNYEYQSVSETQKDFQQIMANCMLFNGPGHPVTEMSLKMERSWTRHMSELPGPDVQEIEKPKTQAKKKGAQKKPAGTKPPPKKKAPTKAQSPTASSTPTFSLQPSGIPQIRRDSLAGDGRPKREIHPPAPKDLPYTQPRRKRNASELKFCESVLKELLKKQHADYAFPFYAPVDPVALNIPDYFKIIKNPMDLGTIKSKLNSNIYENAGEFEKDIRLMFNNCYKFNPPDQSVHIMGRKLEAVFDEQWTQLPLHLNKGSRSPEFASPGPHDDDEMSEDDEDAPDVAELEKKLEAMQEMLHQMKKGKKKSPGRGVSSGNSKSGKNHSRKGSMAMGSGAARSHKKKSAPYITLEQKTELSERINLLPPHRMTYALKMIHDMMPELSNEQGEIELDIDELDPDTLYKLYHYVNKHAPPLPQYHVSYQPPPQAAPEPKKASRPPKGRKNKPMSAEEQEARINELQSRLSNFDDPNAAVFAQTPIAAGNSDSSDDDSESSGSESEEE